jgi:hypothetical protein
VSFSLRLVFVNYNFQKTTGASFQPVSSPACLAFQTVVNHLFLHRPLNANPALQFLLTSQETNCALTPFTASVLMWYPCSVQIIPLLERHISSELSTFFTTIVTINNNKKFLELTHQYRTKLMYQSIRGYKLKASVFPLLNKKHPPFRWRVFCSAHSYNQTVPVVTATVYNHR